MGAGPFRFSTAGTAVIIARIDQDAVTVLCEVVEKTVTAAGSSVTVALSVNVPRQEQVDDSCRHFIFGSALLDGRGLRSVQLLQ